MELPDPSGMSRESQLAALRVCFEVAMKLVYPSQMIRYLIAGAAYRLARQGACEEALIFRWECVLKNSLWWSN